MTRGATLAYVLLLAACGPGLRPSARSASSFQRCEAADYDPSLSAEQRRACWAGWISEYAELAEPGQLQVAQSRITALEAGEPTRPLPSAALEERPLVEHEVYIAPPGEYRETACTPGCNREWDGCISRCETRDKPCRLACEQDYAICNAGCP